MRGQAQDLSQGFKGLGLMIYLESSESPRRAARIRQLKWTQDMFPAPLPIQFCDASSLVNPTSPKP